MTVFQDPLALVFADPDHSENMQRELLVGHSANGPLLPVSFTDREGRIRTVSARRATRTMKKARAEKRDSPDVLGEE